MIKEIVAMICGPHENGKRSYRRIDLAIETALALNDTLMILGDGNFGQDVAEYRRYAKERGVKSIIGLYDSGASTLADVSALSKYLHTHPDCQEVIAIHLVTDNWHMPRATTMLASELSKQMPTRRFIVNTVAVESPPPPKELIKSEVWGLLDFLSGRYGRRASVAQFGKPSHPDSQELNFTFDS